MWLGMEHVARCVWHVVMYVWHACGPGMCAVLRVGVACGWECVVVYVWHACGTGMCAVLRVAGDVRCVAVCVWMGGRVVCGWLRVACY